MTFKMLVELCLLASILVTLFNALTVGKFHLNVEKIVNALALAFSIMVVVGYTIVMILEWTLLWSVAVVVWSFVCRIQYKNCLRVYSEEYALAHEHHRQQKHQPQE